MGDNYSYILDLIYLLAEHAYLSNGQNSSHILVLTELKTHSVSEIISRTNLKSLFGKGLRNCLLTDTQDDYQDTSILHIDIYCYHIVIYCCKSYVVTSKS